jgi:hypothetical protein
MTLQFSEAFRPLALKGECFTDQLNPGSLNILAWLVKGSQSRVGISVLCSVVSKILRLIWGDFGGASNGGH